MYCWIIINVLFDVEGYFEWLVLKGMDSESVFWECVMFSEGYVMFFEDLCKVCKVLVKKVRGFVKGYGY